MSVIIRKKIEADDVLKSLIYMFSETLPENIKNIPKSEILANFCDDNSVEIYIITPSEETKN